MEITTQKLEDKMIVSAQGRLDGYWSEHLSGKLDELVREGNHVLVLDLSKVEYLSSMGIRVLVAFFKKLKAVKGSFSVEKPNESVKQVLELAGLTTLFGQVAAKSTTPLKREEVKKISRGAASYEIYDLEGSGMTCELHGDPTLLKGCHFKEKDAQKFKVSPHVVALGIGAFGNSFEECKNDFGEFFALAGAAAYQAGQKGATGCDFLITEGDFIPEIEVLYGISCKGSFTKLLRFESREKEGSVGLKELTEVALDSISDSLACVVIAAESAGLIGASLKRSPAAGAQMNAPFDYPEIRNWLSFSTERLDAGSLVIASGVVGQKSKMSEKMQYFVRPLSRDQNHLGHFHAAPFRYRPLQKGIIDLNKTVRPLFEGESAQGLLHLLCDERNPDKLEESQFIRGACWIAPLSLETQQKYKLSNSL